MRPITSLLAVGGTALVAGQVVPSQSQEARRSSLSSPPAEPLPDQNGNLADLLRASLAQCTAEPGFACSRGYLSEQDKKDWNIQKRVKAILIGEYQGTEVRNAERQKLDNENELLEVGLQQFTVDTEELLAGSLSMEEKKVALAAALENIGVFNYHLLNNAPD